MLTLLAAITWYVTGPQRLTYAELDDLSSAQQENRVELGQVSAKLEDARKQLAELQGQLANADALPFQSLVEKDLKTLSMLAQGNGVQITRVTPLPSQEYPGLLEQRFSCDAKGKMRDIVSFLHAVETHPFWMDISYLNVQKPQQAFTESGTDNQEQSLAFVVSLFSSKSSGMDQRDTNKPQSRLDPMSRLEVGR